MTYRSLEVGNRFGRYSNSLEFYASLSESPWSLFSSVMSSQQLADENTPLLKIQQVKKTPLPWGQFSLMMVRSRHRTLLQLQVTLNITLSRCFNWLNHLHHKYYTPFAHRYVAILLAALTYSPTFAAHPWARNHQRWWKSCWVGALARVAQF